jgi:hypothetical protein
MPEKFIKMKINEIKNLNNIRIHTCSLKNYLYLCEPKTS